MTIEVKFKVSGETCDHVQIKYGVDNSKSITITRGELFLPVSEKDEVIMILLKTDLQRGGYTSENTDEELKQFLETQAYYI